MTRTRARSRIPGALLLAVALGAPSTAPAVDGVTLINAARARQGGVTPSDGGGVPVTIDAPGSYRLTSDLDSAISAPGTFIIDPENWTVIEVTADDVEIDLGGFTISGPGTPGTGDGVHSTGANTVIRNGTITGVGEDGLDLGDGARVERCTVVGSGQDGIETGAHGSVSSCVVQDNAGYGLHLGASSGFGGNVLDGNNGGNANPQINAKGRDPHELSGNVCGNGTTCVFDGPPDKLVFAVPTQSGGSLGGLAGADSRCQTTAAGGAFPGTFLAWLSDGIDSPATRFTHSPGKYKLVTGTVVALDWDDLTDGALLNPIDRVASGLQTGATPTWTNVTPLGFVAGGVPEDDSCIGWSSNGSLPTGRIGSNHATDATWTSLGFAPCNAAPVYIYCFQQ